MKRLTELTGESWRDYLLRAEVPIKELILKFDEDISLAVNGATDVNSAADVSRLFDAAVGYPAATAAGEPVYPVSGR